jgi:hypothetical protein
VDQKRILWLPTTLMIVQFFSTSGDCSMFLLGRDVWHACSSQTGKLPDQITSGRVPVPPRYSFDDERVLDMSDDQHSSAFAVRPRSTCWSGRITKSQARRGGFPGSSVSADWRFYSQKSCHGELPFVSKQKLAMEIGRQSTRSSRQVFDSVAGVLDQAAGTRSG